jgi:hypothetical protein
MHTPKKRTFWLVIGLLVAAALLPWVAWQQQPPPPRDFTTSQLLVPSLSGWGIYSGPEERTPHFFDLKGAMAGSEIRFLKPPKGIGDWGPDDVDAGLWEPIGDITQWVVKFPSIGYAKRAYLEHYSVLNGPSFSSKPSWEPPAGLEYESRLASEFRVLCDTRLNDTILTSCYLDSVYEEVYVQIHYSSLNPENSASTIGDLGAIARALDSRFAMYLGSHD